MEYRRIPSTTTNMNAVMARTKTDRLRIDSAGGEAGSKIERFCADATALAISKGITTSTPVLAHEGFLLAPTSHACQRASGSRPVCRRNPLAGGAAGTAADPAPTCCGTVSSERGNPHSLLHVHGSQRLSRSRACSYGGSNLDEVMPSAGKATAMPMRRGSNFVG